MLEVTETGVNSDFSYHSLHFLTILPVKHENIFVLSGKSENNFYFGDSFEVSYILRTTMYGHHCNVVQLPGIFQRIPKAMAFQADSELKQIFDHYLRIFIQSGQVGDILLLY